MTALLTSSIDRYNNIIDVKEKNNHSTGCGADVSL